jgi:hypothetical protein
MGPFSSWSDPSPGVSFLAGLLRGIAMFIWTYLAYTALLLGGTGLRRLPNESAVLEANQGLNKDGKNMIDRFRAFSVRRFL